MANLNLIYLSYLHINTPTPILHSVQLPQQLLLFQIQAVLVTFVLKTNNEINWELNFIVNSFVLNRHVKFVPTLSKGACNGVVIIIETGQTHYNLVWHPPNSIAWTNTDWIGNGETNCHGITKKCVMAFRTVSCFIWGNVKISDIISCVWTWRQKTDKECQIWETNKGKIIKTQHYTLLTGWYSIFGQQRVPTYTI